MKKRSMLAIASLATGFVVAAVTPSHAVGDGLSNINVGDTLQTIDNTIASESLQLDKNALVGDQGEKADGKQGQKGKPSGKATGGKQNQKGKPSGKGGGKQGNKGH
ncbi:hypothetical protein ACIP2X_13525 [Streptomyces sp. NPDC089424]|uniref:hypothetical protein n=1 Tax=Streptomyces sp. NPDC089424 TaxID=3365917 RepID=UPI003826E7F0